MRKMLILGLVAVLSMGRPMIPFPIEEGALNRMVDLRMRPETEAVQLADGRKLYTEKFHVKLEVKSEQIPIRRISWSLQSLKGRQKEGQESGERLEIKKGELARFDREESEEGSVYRGDSEIEIEGAGEEDRVRLAAEIELITGQKILKNEEYELDFREPELAVSLRGEKKAIYAGPVEFHLLARDANLDREHLEVTLDKNPLSVEWKGEGEESRGRIRVSGDGRHRLELTGRDLAGHESRLVSETFIIDQTKPIFQMEGLSEGSHRGKVSGRIRVEDAHPDPRATRLRLVRQTREERSDLSREVQQTSEGELLFPEHIFSEDGRYTIEVSARDAAGNRSYLSRSFLVNRRGSAFQLEGDARELFDQTLRHLPDFLLREDNLDAMETGFPRLLLRQDGISRLLRPGDYRLDSDQDENGFWRHVYRIPRNLFETDGLYEIEVMTRDVSGNQGRFGEKEGLRFRLDRTKPVIYALSLEDGLRVDSDQYTVELVIRDNQEVRKIRCFLDKNEVPLRIEGNRYFLDLAGGSYEEIRLEAEDAAGNRSERVYRGIHVGKKNILERLTDLTRGKGKEGEEKGQRADDLTGKEEANTDGLMSAAGQSDLKKEDAFLGRGSQGKAGLKKTLPTGQYLILGGAFGALLAGGLIWGVLIRRARDKK